MRPHLPKAASSVLIAAVIGSILWVNAGDLNPPGGPVAPTMKPLTDVEPRIAVNATNTPGDADSVYRIASPGSYYLTANLTGTAGKAGIEIAAGNVTIDLMGHSMLGTAGSLDGVRTLAAFNNIAIRSGVISSWGGDGVDLSTTGDVNGSLIEEILASNNGDTGIRAGDAAVVRNCVAMNNATTGIRASDNAVIDVCSARLNGAQGIEVLLAGAVRGCSAGDNAGAGIVANHGSTIAGCNAYSNDLAGILLGENCVVTESSASNNGQNGIDANFGASISNCSSAENGGHGVAVTNSSQVTDCTAASNAGDGIHCTGGGNTISRCTAANNSGDGIDVSSDSLVEGNTCDGNGLLTGSGAGIHVTSTDNRIDANTVTDNDRGIDVDVGDNLIIRNTAADNGVNFDIIAQNHYGPIIDITGGGTPAVAGNAAAGTAGSSDPWANFSF